MERQPRAAERERSMSDSAVEDHELPIDVHLGETLKLELAPVVVPQRANGAETDVTPVLMPIRYRVQVELQRGPDALDLAWQTGRTRSYSVVVWRRP